MNGFMSILLTNISYHDVLIWSWLILTYYSQMWIYQRQETQYTFAFDIIFICTFHLKAFPSKNETRVSQHRSSLSHNGICFVTYPGTKQFVYTQAKIIKAYDEFMQPTWRRYNYTMERGKVEYWEGERERDKCVTCVWSLVRTVLSWPSQCEKWNNRLEHMAVATVQTSGVSVYILYDSSWSQYCSSVGCIVV